jgi:hypothetical protein
MHTQCDYHTYVCNQIVSFMNILVDICFQVTFFVRIDSPQKLEMLKISTPILLWQMKGPSMARINPGYYNF